MKRAKKVEVRGCSRCQVFDKGIPPGRCSLCGAKRVHLVEEPSPLTAKERAELKKLRAKVRRYKKALNVAVSLTGWSSRADVDAQIQRILHPTKRAVAALEKSHD